MGQREQRYRIARSRLLAALDEAKPGLAAKLENEVDEMLNAAYDAGWQDGHGPQMEQSE